MAFGETTESFGSREEVRAFLDLHGGICDAQTDQETTIFALSIRRNAINEGVKLLLETAFRPVIDEKNVAEAIQNVDNETKTSAQLRVLLFVNETNALVIEI